MPIARISPRTTGKPATCQASVPPLTTMARAKPAAPSRAQAASARFPLWQSTYTGAEESTCPKAANPAYVLLVTRFKATPYGQAALKSRWFSSDRIGPPADILSK